MFSLLNYIEELNKSGLLVESDVDFDAINGVTDNSRNVLPGNLFVCKGKWFKTEYLADAVAKGAACYMSETLYDEGTGCPHIIVTDVRKAMIRLAIEFYDHPSEELSIAGFTGTKGKTTATHFMKSALEEWDRAECGKPCGLISTLEMFDGEKTVESINTTPEPIELNQWLRSMIDNGLRHCSLEVSSQALRYGRTAGVKLKVGTFLTLGRDHISPVEHKDLEDYYTAKLMIFDQSETGIVNLDTELSDRTLAYAKEKTERAWTYSMNDESADFYAYDLGRDGDHTVFKVKSRHFSPETVQEFRISMPGIFNVSNATAVIASCVALGEPVEYIKKGIADLKIEGHMEVFKTKDGNIVAVADYAHNKLSYEALFDAVQEEYPEHYKNLRVVYGSVGDKAEERREELGTITGKRAKMSYITADYPGHEPFDKIASEIAHFVELQHGDYVIIEDRNEAIEKAFADSEGKTAILACGFGRLTGQKYGDEYIQRESDVDCIIRLIKDYDETH